MYMCNNFGKFDINDLIREVNKEDIEKMVQAAKKMQEELNSIDVKKVEKKMTFEDALSMTDVEIQIRYDYLDSLLYEIDDEIFELFEEIERLKIDLDIAKALEDKFTMQKIESIISFKELELEKLEDKQYIIEDMFEEVFLGILANIE